ncbi:peroxisomal membrane protein PMP47A [Apiosordaria backusii]|uniref:Peroxisomal membrane protein PMP47A n=1 Tax=Apiosordaria backusii TaxID=314023 RepID=A0AA40EZQ9_9PEZI|nr:peroxisomal membrane protein PMP47A [Apiosordaria backusii]
MSAQSKPVVLPQNDNVAHALAGAGGGILSMALTYPLITLSTRAQVESKRPGSETAFLAAVQKIVAREGVSGLYSGLSSALFGISVTNFVYYYWYEWTRAFFEAAALKNPTRHSKKLTTVESMIAGAIAGSATVILTNPIWVVNTRMTTRKAASSDDNNNNNDQKEGETTTDVEAQNKAKTNKKPSTIGTLLALLKKEGPQALFAGVVPALVLVINPILQYTLFEQMKNTVEKKRRITPGVAFVLGALGKLFATTVTYPYITVKSQMHVQEGNRKEGVTEALKRVVREEGYAGLYKGIGPKVSQSVITAACLFAFKDVLYEYSVRLRGSMARKAIA